MAKQKQVLHMVDNGKEYRVIKYYGRTNPYRLYQYMNVYGDDGFLHEKRVLLAEYCCMNSIFWYMVQNNIGY